MLLPHELHFLAEKLKKNLQDVGLVWVIQMPEGKDLNDCDKSEFDMLYANKIWRG